MKEAQIEQIVLDLMALYHRYGAEEYIGEPVSQLEHMSQSADLAIKAGYDDEVILAAFFHDLGHICHRDAPATMGSYGTWQHEKQGADYLRRLGFSERLARLVESHVLAKRYLTFKNPAYYAALSEASRQTLTYQGGPMTAVEATAFEKDELFEVSIRMRQWDELAKETEQPVIDLRQIEARCVRHLTAQLR